MIENDTLDTTSKSHQLSWTSHPAKTPS